MNAAATTAAADGSPPPPLRPRVGVIVFPGSNCDRDAGAAVAEVLGSQALYLWHEDRSLPSFLDAVIVPGGFSYGDALRAGAIARFAPLMEEVHRFAERGGMVLGICNGFQILCEAHLLPGALVRNEGLRFVCRHVFLRVEATDTPFTSEYREGEVLKVPIAHGEGRFTCDDATHARLVAENRIVFRYCDGEGRVVPEANPNGSRDNIAGIVGGPARNILGMMPHPERAVSVALGSADGRGAFVSVRAALAAAAAAAASSSQPPFHALAAGSASSSSP